MSGLKHGFQPKTRNQTMSSGEEKSNKSASKMRHKNIEVSIFNISGADRRST